MESWKMYTKWTCCLVRFIVKDYESYICSGSVSSGWFLTQNIVFDKDPLLWFLKMAAIVPVPRYHVHSGPVPLNGPAGTL